MQWGTHYAVGMRYAISVSAKKVNSHSALSKYGCWGLLPLMQIGQTHTVGYAVLSRCWCKKVNSDCVLSKYGWYVGTITFSAKKVNSHSALSKYGCWGLLPLMQIGPHTVGYAVLSRCWCKKVNSDCVLSKYGWWGPLPLVQKAKMSTHTVYFLHQHLLRTASPTVWGLTFLH